MNFGKLAAGLCLALVIAVGAGGPSRSAPLESVEEAIAEIVNFKLPGSDEKVAQANIRADQRWDLLASRKEKALPLIRAALEKQLAGGAPNPFALIDLGYFMALGDEADDRDLVVRSLLAIDLDSPVTRINDQQVFLLAHRAAWYGDDRILPVLDRLYLAEERTVMGPNPAHPLTLDGSLLTAVAFGTLGDSGEAYLLARLKADTGNHVRIVEALNWMGSPRGVEAVLDLARKHPSEQMAAAAIGFFMRVGGAEGRAAALALIDGPDLPASTSRYLQQVRPAVAAVNTKSMIAKFSDPADVMKKMSDQDLEKALAEMLEDPRRKPAFHPAALLNSGLEDQYLADKLTAIRSRIFRHLTPEAIGQVSAMNFVINVLRYRVAEAS